MERQRNIPIKKFVEVFLGNDQSRDQFLRREASILKESRGSRISSTFSPWNSMKVGMSRADSGASYLIPCLIDKDFNRRRAVRRRHQV